MGFFDIFLGKARKEPLTAVISPSVQNEQERIYHDLALAESIYANIPPWLFEESPPLSGVGLGALIASEATRLITIESEIEVSDAEIDGIFKRRVIPNLRTEIEKGWALGGLIFKPYFNNAVMSVDSEGRVASINGNMKIGFFYPSQFYVKDYDLSGNILKISFFTTIEKDNVFYTLSESQNYDENERSLTITNEVYKNTVVPNRFIWNNLGSNTVPLDTVEQWQKLLPRMVFPNVDGCLIGYYKPAQANNKNIYLPYGSSPLVRAANAIKRADLTYNALDWEINSSLARLYVDETTVPSKMTPKLDKMFVKMNPDSNGGGMFEKFSPAIRDVSYLNIYDAHLRQIEDIVGLAHGTISRVEATARTATEIVMSKQRTFAMVTDNQKVLETALRQLVYAISVWREPSAVSENIDIKFDWDDSVVSNPDEKVQTLLQLQREGNIPKYKANMEYFGYSKEEAMKLVEEVKADNEEKINLQEKDLTKTEKAI